MLPNTINKRQKKKKKQKKKQKKKRGENKLKIKKSKLSKWILIEGSCTTTIITRRTTHTKQKSK